MFGLGTPEVLIILFVILLLFGAKRLPELARGLGKSMGEFRRAAAGAEEEFRSAMDVEKSAKQPQAAQTPKAAPAQADAAPPPPVTADAEKKA